jgi:hypothetical protein
VRPAEPASLTFANRKPRPDGSSAARSEALAAIAALERCTPANAAPTASPLLDGRWSLLWTCSAVDAAAGAQASARDDDAFGLRAAIQAASDTAYSYFYKRLPFIAGAAPAGSALGPARATGACPCYGYRGPPARADLRAIHSACAGTWQTIDRAARRVANEAELELLPGSFFSVVVGGSAVAGSATRLDVQFLDFQLRLGSRDKPLRLELPLSLVAPRGSVETTYLDEDVRIGRGDKGSVFVCARA